MRLSLHRLLHRITLASLVVACAAAPVAAEETALSAHVAQLKQTQVRFMMRGAQRRAARYATRKAAKGKTAGSKGAVAGARRLPATRQEPPDPPRTAPLGVENAQAPASTTAIATNRLVNNPATDTALCPSAPCTGMPWSGQCEVSIVAHGSNVVAAWNDGEGFQTGSSTQGYAYSNNGGVTWADGGTPPVSGGIVEWTSDPVLAVNEKTGEFYFSALCDPSASTNGIGVVKGTFVGGALVWQTPEMAIVANNNGTMASPGALLDKQWLVADSTTGNLYMTYTRFPVVNGAITTNRIDFQRKTASWSIPLTLSAGADAGRVQGSRVAVGPEGYVWATWNAIGSSALDFMRVRRSTTQGTTFGVQADGVSQYTNFGTGAPGFNRGSGFAFPGLAIDRSTGPRRGRAYITWNESINFYTDPIGSGTTVNESEVNDTHATGDAFNLGQNLTGIISAATDLDYFRFTGTAGQTIICQFETSAPTLDASFRLFCSDGTTRLGFSEAGLPTAQPASGLIVFTLPANGTYSLRVAAFAGTGAYTIATGLNGAVTERARDHRDVFTSSSPDNVPDSWSTPVRVNGEAALYDDWLPEIAVAADGNVYVAWYDWRDATPGACAGASMTYLSRSTNGGVTWPDGSPVTDALSPWTTAYSNIAPNQGDYISLFANPNAIYTCWSDGRSGNPDVYMAAVGLAFTPVQVSVASTHVEPGLVRVVWYAADAPGLTATVYRRTDGGEWSDLGQVSPDGTGQMVYEDRDVVAATRYHYRLGVREDAEETYTGEVTVDVPAGVALAIDDVRPNPADGEMWVSFTLPNHQPATLELIDISGRRVRERSISGAGRQTVDLAAGARLPPGVYVIRLTQDGRSTVKRVSVVR
jgi:type IX secretion system substrate protein